MAQRRVRTIIRLLWAVAALTWIASAADLPLTFEAPADERGELVEVEVWLTSMALVTTLGALIAWAASVRARFFEQGYLAAMCDCRMSARAIPEIPRQEDRRDSNKLR